MQINSIGSFMPKNPSFQGGKVTISDKQTFDAWYFRSSHGGSKNKHPWIEYYTDDNGNHSDSFINPNIPSQKAEALIKSVQKMDGENNHLDLRYDIPFLKLENGKKVAVDFVEGRMIATKNVLGTTDELEDDIYYSDKEPALELNDRTEGIYHSKRRPIVKLENGEEHIFELHDDIVVDCGKVLHYLG